MIQCVRAIYQKGVLRPLDTLELEENAEVRLTVEATKEADKLVPNGDPFEGIRFDGPPDLAENFDDYRFGRKIR